MKNIQLVHEGEDYIKLSFESRDGKIDKVEITGATTIQVIKTLGKALYKNSFIKKD